MCAKNNLEKIISDKICIHGARENNLKNIDIEIPHNQLVVITGLSGSGKSSLAFDTIFAESQRRYMETFSAYARQFIGKLERPDVDEITGLSPAVSIEQKTISKNPRSTVGTITEIYDFLRLLFARAASAYSYNTGKEMISLTEAQILERIEKKYDNQKIHILSPLVKGRKGHYRELFETWNKKGFLKMKIDGQIVELKQNLKVDRYKVHDIDLLVDTLIPDGKSLLRLKNSVATALKYGKGQCIIWDQETDSVSFYSKNLMCEDTGLSYNMPEPNSFSFNSPYGACPKCNGIGMITEVDIEKVFPEPRLSIREGGLAPLGKYKTSYIFNQINALGKKHGFGMDEAVSKLSDEVKDILLYGSGESLYITNEYVGITSPMPVKYEGVVAYIEQQNTDDAPVSLQRWAAGFMAKKTCPECNGQRLKKESLHFLINNKNISQVSDMQIDHLLLWIDEAQNKLNERQQQIARDVIKEIKHRLRFLLDVGLEYISLSRPARSLSGGESQRIRLATQIASNLTGVLYILDEPSIGLHQRDNKRLILSLQQLRDKGNSIIVVEHDQEMIMSADYIIDIGPGAGRKGGRIMGAGTPKQMMNCESITCAYLNGKLSVPIPSERRKGNGKYITLKNCSGNNLKNVTFTLPLGMFVCITGVSGSGKSTLINETLYPAASQIINRSFVVPMPHSEADGFDNINKVIEVNQDPIGKTPRSNPATYTGVFDNIRQLFTETTQSKIRGYKPGRFSFNVKGGRCETCKGAGLENIEMGILPNVLVLCRDCNGKRFNRETLEIRFKGKSIHDILQMTINQACEFFEEHPKIIQALKALQKVGLGYLSLGQSSTTLSGGENQRVKLASELAKKDTGKTLYILDEPTTGLHFEDVRVLLDILHGLADKGNTVVVIEHNTDVIKVADYIIDLGPEGGDRGGEIVAQGTPEEIINNKKSYTGEVLKDVIRIAT
jgi:excinuclease ABC subunit A